MLTFQRILAHRLSLTGAGAGIQADLKTITISAGLDERHYRPDRAERYGRRVGIHARNRAWFQFKTVREGFPIAAGWATGMLLAEIIEVEAGLQGRVPARLIPNRVSQSGSGSSRRDAVNAAGISSGSRISRRPTVLEAKLLADMKIRLERHRRRRAASRALPPSSSRAVFAGLHARIHGLSVSGTNRSSARRLSSTPNNHGTGTLFEPPLRPIWG